MTAAEREVMVAEDVEETQWPYSLVDDVNGVRRTFGGPDREGSIALLLEKGGM